MLQNQSLLADLVLIQPRTNCPRLTCCRFWRFYELPMTKFSANIGENVVGDPVEREARRHAQRCEAEDKRQIAEDLVRLCLLRVILYFSTFF